MTIDPKIIYTGPSPRGWHRLQQAAECLQKYAWTYVAPRTGGKTDTKSPALIKGSLIHLALAQHYARMRALQRPSILQLSDDVIDSVDAWVEPEKAVELIAKLEGTPEFVSDVIDTYRAYVKHYPEDVRRWKVLDVEELMSTKIEGRYLLTGRMDLGIEDMGGRIWIVDHKTTSRLTSAHKQYYTISGQLIGYSHMARQKYGDRFAGLIVNLIQHGDSPKFERITLPRSPNLESRFERIVVDIEEAIERMEASGRDFDDWPKAINEMTCYGRYGACPFLDQCRFGAGAKKAGNWSWSG